LAQAAPEPAPANRRTHERVEVPAVASAGVAGAPLSVWAVRDLSSGGASMRGGPALTPGTRHAITFHVADGSFTVSARVLRRQVNAPAGQFAVLFEKVDAEQAAAIARALATGRGPARATHIVVASRPSRARSSLARELQALGHEPAIVESPLGAAALLQARASNAVLLIEDKLIEVDGWSCAEFIRDCRPQVRRLAIASKVHSFRLNLALRAGLVDAAVEPPFRAAALAVKLALPAARPRRSR
jgi:hypothetical protein